MVVAEDDAMSRRVGGDDRVTRLMVLGAVAGGAVRTGVERSEEGSTGAGGGGVEPVRLPLERPPEPSPVSVRDRDRKESSDYQDGE